MSFLDAVLLGIVEGVSEFLPISSTGHLLLAAHLLALPQTEFLKTFEVVIQLGAILSVIVLYGSTFLKSGRVLLLAGVAFLPTAVAGFLARSLIKNFLFERPPIVLWALLAGGLVLIVFERNHREPDEAVMHVEHMSLMQAAGVGFSQTLAFIPGISRSAASIIGGLLLGLSRRTAVDFSFLIAVPTVLGASALDLVKADVAFTGREWLLLATGFIASFFVALAAIHWFIFFLGRHTFVAFGVYRIALALLFALLLLR